MKPEYDSMKALRGVITCDIGLNTAGALWTGGLHPSVREFHRLHVGELPDYIRQMRDSFGMMLSYFRSELGGKIKLVLIEGTKVYDGLVSQTSAKRGDLIVLSYLVGVYCAECDMMNIPFDVVTASEWKGQLSKEATEYRVRRINGGREYATEHSFDAVAMGYSLVPSVWRLGYGKR